MATRKPTQRAVRTKGNGGARTGPPFLTVAVLGAGAPHAGLLAGALAYLYQQGKTFDVFFTSGGGALIGLLFVAPRRHKRADEALRDVAEFGIDDRIYRLFPVGYKTFFKDSWFTRQVREWAEQFKLDVEPRPFPGQTPPPGYDPKEQRRRRLFNDVVDFWASALTPPRIGPTSLGLCAHLPFLEDMIDFPRANRSVSPSGLGFADPFPIVVPLPRGTTDVITVPVRLGWFYVNGYNLDKKEMQQFSNVLPANKPSGFAGSLTPDSIRAALSFPFIYPPQEINGSLFCEGAEIDPLNLPNATEVIVNLDERVVPNAKTMSGIRYFLFDILGTLEDQLMYRPRTLWEAYGLSVLTPVISLAQMSKKIFLDSLAKPDEVLVPVEFDLPARSSRRPVDWSYSNTTELWDAGWEAGRKFFDAHAAELPDRVGP